MAAALIFVIVAAISFPISAILTKRHKDLGEEQLGIISLKYPDKLKLMLSRLHE
ncbi:MAG: hypothetical protein RIA63_13245 [Cyclobacteriaceae bacterium]